ncbi:hypothetical protein C0995_014570 [Termitomyces sp. Mi166|nr:hypothetical protein C0995_014570 [Termitomyces sp. Mi166\
MAPSPKSLKVFAEHVEDVEKDNVQEYSPELEKSTLRKVDFRILPLLGLIYSVAVVDRVNTGVARVAGMEKDLRLDIGNRYSVVACIYFIPYILLQLPSNIVLRKLGARIWIGICVICWGAAQLGMGFVPTWGYLTLCRALLGVFEAGLLPALVFVISTWYKRHEVQTRMATFYLCSIFIGGFSPIFGYALNLIAPRGGLHGWQWIFVIEGIITIVIGLITYIFFPEFPDNNRFLSSEQTKLVLARVQEDRGDAIPDQMTGEKLLRHLSDWTIWAYAFMLLCATVPAYAIGFFVPIILSSMGYHLRDSLLLSAPPSLFAVRQVYACFLCGANFQNEQVIFAFGFAYISDRTRKRAPIIAFQTILTIIGLAVTAYSTNNGARYFGLCLSNVGACASVPGVLAYSANNVVSHTKRSVSTAVIVTFGGVAGVFATTVFRQEDYPRYLNGMWASLGCQFLLLVLLAMTSFTFIRRNRLAREGKIGPLEGQPGFYYTI